MGRGIDYGLGTTNIDKDNGIRYGVINQNMVTQSWCDSSEADYGEPSCPKCGNEAVDGKSDCSDYACDSCCYLFDADEAFGDEANGFYIDDGEYKATQGGGDCDIFILKSPYYTRAAFCSPCAPGACYLESPTYDGEKAYCFGEDWFDSECPCPYPIYRVDNDELVYTSEVKA